MAVVKADAYGHGAVECAKELEKANVDLLGVALPEEGLELRNHGIKSPIVCLGGFWSGQESLIIENRISPVVYRIEQANRLNQSAAEKKIVFDIHLKIDTGMGRIGVLVDELKSFIEKLKKCRNLNLIGVMTHFAAADDLAEIDFTNLQIKKFQSAVDLIEARGFKPVYKDMANSPGAIAHKNSRGNLVRIGGILYGLGGDVLPESIVKPHIKPVMSIYSRISHLKRISEGETVGYGRTFKAEKQSLIATVPIGYYDGYARGLSNKANVIINNSFAPVIGRVSMDWIMVDVTDVHKVNVEDEVIIIGQNGNLIILAEDIAKINNTISYEITCGISRRVPRIFC